MNITGDVAVSYMSNGYPPINNFSGSLYLGNRTSWQMSGLQTNSMYSGVQVYFDASKSWTGENKIKKHILQK